MISQIFKSYGGKISFISPEIQAKKLVGESVESPKSFIQKCRRIAFIVTFSILFSAPCPPGFWAGLS
jgi:hypothetical protein